MQKNNYASKIALILMCLIILPVTLASAQSSKPSLKIKEKNGKFGMNVKDGFITTKVLPCDYDSIQALKHNDYGGLFLVYQNNNEGVFGCKISSAYDKVEVDTMWAIPVDTYSLNYLGERKGSGWSNMNHFFLTGKDNKYGLLAVEEPTYHSKWILPCDYQNYSVISQLVDLNHVTAFVKNNGKWGVVTERYGDMLVNVLCEYDSLVVDGTRDLHAFALNNGKWGYLNILGDFKYDRYESLVLPCEYDIITTAFIDDNGNLSTTPYGAARGMLLKNNGKYGWSSATPSPRTGLYDIFLPCEYDEISSMRLNFVDYLEFQKDGKVGLFSFKENKIIIPLGDYVAGSEAPIGDRITMSSKNGKSVSYDRQGNRQNVVWGQRVDAQRFHNMGGGEFFYVSKAASGPYTAIVNKNDKVIVNLANTKIIGYNETQNVWYAKRNGKIGAINGTTGGIIAPFAFNGTVGPYSGNGNVCVYKDGTPKITYYIYSPSGKLIIQKAFTTSQKFQRERFFQDYL